MKRLGLTLNEINQVSFQHRSKWELTAFCKLGSQKKCKVVKNKKENTLKGHARWRSDVTIVLVTLDLCRDPSLSDFLFNIQVKSIEEEKEPILPALHNSLRKRQSHCLSKRFTWYKGAKYSRCTGCQARQRVCDASFVGKLLPPQKISLQWRNLVIMCFRACTSRGFVPPKDSLMDGSASCQHLFWY